MLGLDTMSLQFSNPFGGTATLFAFHSNIFTLISN